jgi:uncharacterized coiled-coil DUF342 family protein
MSDNGNVESHTIRLLQEMRAEANEFRQEMGGFRHEMTEFKQEMTDFKHEMFEFKQEMTVFKQEMTGFRHETERRLGVLEPAMLEVLGVVKVIAKTQEQHTALLLAHNEKLCEFQRAQNITEKDLRVIRGRVERIEDHIGLVKA